MPTEPILAETIAGIQRTLGADLDRIVVERAVVGLFFTGVKLDTGVAAACATPLRSIPEAVCCPSSVMAMPFPGKLRGRLASDLLKETEATSGIRRAVGVATMNALAAMCWERHATPDVDLQIGVDAYDAANIQPGEHVVVVGAFVPFLKALKRAGQTFTVLEMDPATLKPDELTHFRPPEQASQVVPDADVVLITGTTLLNDTLENLLALCRPDTRVVLVGPTVGLYPDAFLRRGADVLGGVRVTAPDAFLDVLAEGGSGYHFFGRSAEKVVVVRKTPAMASRAA
jgi:uncharacterized protein (DUF4213/DUF364 family)